MAESYPRQRARTRAFRLGAPRAFTPSPEGTRVAFLRSRGGSDPVSCLWVLDLPAASERCVADPATMLSDAEELPAEERARRERMREVSSGITDYAVDRAVRVAAFALSGVPYAVSLDDPAATPLPLDAPGPVIDPRPDPTGTWCAYVHAGGLYVVPLDGGPARALCLPEHDAQAWGLADFIAAEEHDRVRGYWWLPDGSGLLVERYDETAVSTWWIADPAHPEAPARPHRYPAAGTANADVSLWRVRLSDGDVSPVAWDRDDLPYLTQVTTSSHGAPLVTVLSRDQRRQVTYEVDPDSASALAVIERTDPQWIDVMPGVPARAPGGGILEIVSDRDADAQRLTLDGVALTPGELQVEALVDIGDADALVIAGSDPVAPGLHRVSYDGTVTRVVPDESSGTSSGRRSGDTMVVSRTRLDSTATTVEVYRDRTAIASIASLAETPVISPRPVLHRLGDRQLHAAVLFPADHVPGSRRLPVIMSPYGGPHARLVVAAGLGFGSAQWLADQGYCVIVADGRGTPGRGPAWDRTVKGDLATPALEDQVAALEGAAAAYPDDIDTSRVGIRGWSFGGYLAALAVLRRPDVFHAAVAGAPVTEWRLYDTGYTERYLGDPQADPAAYDRSSLLPLAAELTRPLLIIHGLADDNVVVAHSLQLSSALLAAGRPHSVLPLSGVTHMTPQEVVAENLLRAELDFFSAALQP
ncbi:MAG: prolyl oligopeptidase family serine peptidase [Candidatus Nanopelagicales bacterium]